MQRNIQTMEQFGLNAEGKQQELALDFDRWVVWVVSDDMCEAKFWAQAKTLCLRGNGNAHLLFPASSIAYYGPCV